MAIPKYCTIKEKDETIISVIKRLFGEQITSRLVRTQNKELSLRCIAYNMHRLTVVLTKIGYTFDYLHRLHVAASLSNEY
jgi:hypothetical protein